MKKFHLILLLILSIYLKSISMTHTPATCNSGNAAWTTLFCLSSTTCAETIAPACFSNYLLYSYIITIIFKYI